jgi:putative hydroxymethylpyrimidine transport system substrate-binding protein
MRICSLLAVMLAVALLAGCGEGSEAETSEAAGFKPREAANVKPLVSAEACKEASTKAGSRPQGSLRSVWVAMDGWDSAETVGLVMAEDRGYFAEAGLAVVALSPSGPAAAIPFVLGGSDEIGVVHAPQVVLAKERGAPIVIIGSMVPESTAAMIWLEDSGIEGIADLEGKTIAIPGPSFQMVFLKRVLAEEGLTLDDVEVKRVGNALVPALIDGDADAIFGGSGNLEGVDLEARGFEPVVTPVRDLGFPAYDELVLVARADRAAARPELMCGFVKAVAGGAAATADDPVGAVDALKTSGESNPEISRSSTRAQLYETTPLLSQRGYVSPEQIERLVDWMYDEEMIKRRLPLAALLTATEADSSRAAGS